MATRPPPLSHFGSALPSSTHPAVGAWTEQPRISCSEARPSALGWTWGPGLGGPSCQLRGKPVMWLKPSPPKVTFS